MDDERKTRSDRFPPTSAGTPRGYNFFEARARLRLETVVHIAAAARLRDEFGWIRDHTVFESPKLWMTRVNNYSIETPSTSFYSRNPNRR